MGKKTTQRDRKRTAKCARPAQMSSPTASDAASLGAGASHDKNSRHGEPSSAFSAAGALFTGDDFFLVGQEAVLRGIVSKPDLNGSRVRIEQRPSEATNGRYGVRLVTGGEVFAVLRKKLTIPPEVVQGRPRGDSAPGEDARAGFEAPPRPVAVSGWEPGEEAVLLGLKTRPDLNGQRVVVEPDPVPAARPRPRRVTVLVPATRELLRIAPEKLLRPPPPSTWRDDVLQKPDILFSRAKQAFARGGDRDLATAASCAFEAQQIHSTYGQDPDGEPFRFSSKRLEEECNEFFLRGYQKAADGGKLDSVSRILDRVNRKLRLDTASAKQKFMATEIGRESLKRMQEEAPFMAAMMGMGEGEQHQKLLREWEAKLRDPRLTQQDREGVEGFLDMMRRSGRSGSEEPSTCGPSVAGSSGGDAGDEVETLRGPRDFLAVEFRRKHFLSLTCAPNFSPKKEFIPLLNGSMSALTWAFFCCLPVAARMAINYRNEAGNIKKQGNNSSVSRPKIAPNNLAPELQWSNTLYHIVKSYETPAKFKNDKGENDSLQATKFQIEDPDETEGIMLEVLGVRQLSAGVAEEIGGLREADFKEPSGDVSLGAVPVLFVRYIHNTKATMDVEKIGPIILKWMNTTTISGHGESGSLLIRTAADSAADVRCGAGMLARNQSLLKANKKIGDGIEKTRFVDSVLFPPDIKLVEKLLEMQEAEKKERAFCAGCAGVFRIPPAPGHCVEKSKCPRCNVEQLYCSQKCREAEFPVHDKICLSVERTKICLDDVSDELADDHRPSLTFDAVECTKSSAWLGSKKGTLGPGMCSVGVNQCRVTGKISFNLPNFANGPEGEETGNEIRNIHGRREFIVKIQEPIVGRLTQGWQTYDEGRSFGDAWIQPDTIGLWEVLEPLMHRDGIRKQNAEGIYGWKGYFWARFEGKRVRVFLNKLAPAQPW